MVRPIILYCSDYTPPAGAVWLTSRIAAIPIESRYVNITDEKQSKTDTTKPKVQPPKATEKPEKPGRSAKDESPKNALVRSKTVEHIDFDRDVFYINSHLKSEARFFNGAHECEVIDEIHEAYGPLKAFIRDNAYWLGSYPLTLTDWRCLVTDSPTQILAPAVHIPRLCNSLHRLIDWPLYDDINGRRVVYIYTDGEGANKKAKAIQSA